MKSGRSHSSSDQVPSRLGQLIDTASSPTTDKMGWDSRSNLFQLGPGTALARISRRPNSSFNLGPSRLEQVVDPAAAWSRDRVGRDILSTNSSSDGGPRRM